MENDKSQTIVYPNGDILDTIKVRSLLIEYYQLSKAEKRAFDRLKDRSDLKEKTLKTV